MRALLRAPSVLCLPLLLGASTAFAQAQAPGAPGTAPPPAGTSSLSAGGLAPPPALESAPPSGAAPATPARTEAELAKADKEDAGRGLEFVWLGGEVGVMHLGLGAFKNDAIVDPLAVNTKQTGLVAGAGAGVRLVFLTFGARFRYAPLPDAKLWTLGAEAGIHAPFGALEPYGTLGLGYVSVGSLAGNGSVTLRGFDARLGGGLDYYFTNMFSLGANVGVELMLLSREAQSCAAGTPASVAYCTDGSSVGGAVTASAVAGLHF